MTATRRTILAVAGVAALAATRPRADTALASRGRRLAGLLRGPAPARHIATAYLAGIGETDANRAARDLGMPAILAPLDAITETTAARAWLGARIRADFAAGAVIDVAGWRLSRTEVGACLLATAEA